MRWKLKLVCCLLVLSSSSLAHSSSSRTAYDGWHVMGSCIGTAYLNHAGLEWYQAAIVMISLGIIWELLDQVSYELHWQQNVFDHYRGGEWKDIVRNGIGISFSFPIRRR